MAPRAIFATSWFKKMLIFLFIQLIFILVEFFELNTISIVTIF